MTYVVAATWRAKEGQEGEVRRILSEIAPLVRAEPGCRLFVTHESPDDPHDFFLYEQYEDEAAFEAHLAADHFARLVRGDAVPRLERRERAFYVTMD